MAVIKLHPKVRENLKPRISASALAEYLIMKPDQQETVLHNSRFSSPPIVSHYSEAMLPIKAYCSDPARPKATLSQAVASLMAKSADTSIRPKAREESLRCVETLELFQRGENAFGLNGLRLRQCERLAPFAVNGVMVSMQPDLLVQSGGGDGSVGIVIIRPHKAPDPAACRLEETRRQKGEHRREMARYMLAIASIMMDQQADHFGRFDRGLSFVADIRMQERIPFSTSDNSARARAIRAACRQIFSLWDTIEPRRSVLAK